MSRNRTVLKVTSAKAMTASYNFSQAHILQGPYRPAKMQYLLEKLLDNLQDIVRRGGQIRRFLAH